MNFPQTEGNLWQVVGITGKKQHGKDTLGKYLVNRYGYIRIAFADAIKEMLRPSFGFSEEQLNGTLKEVEDPFWKISPRKVMQFVGTELFRNKMPELIPEVESNFWVLIVKKKILDILQVQPEAKFVITDVRFENELEFINKMNGLTICVVRPTLFDNLEYSHSSESNIENLKVQSKIINDGSIEELHECFNNILFSSCPS